LQESWTAVFAWQVYAMVCRWWTRSLEVRWSGRRAERMGSSTL